MGKNQLALGRVEGRAGVWAGLIGSSPNCLGSLSWEESWRRWMRFSDGAAWFALGMRGFAQGRAVRCVRLNRDEMC